MFVGLTMVHVGRFDAWLADLHVGQCEKWVWDWNRSVAPKHSRLPYPFCHGSNLFLYFLNLAKKITDFFVSRAYVVMTQPLSHSPLNFYLNLYTLEISFIVNLQYPFSAIFRWFVIRSLVNLRLIIPNKEKVDNWQL